MPTEEALVQGTPEQFGEFYERTEDAVLAYFRSRVGGPELAVDLTAECFAQALRSRYRFDPTRGPARAWLFGIAGHVLSRSLRRGRVEDRTRRRLGMEPVSLDDAALVRVEELSGIDVVSVALEELPSAQREAVRARVIHEQPYEQIAEQLAVSEAVVRKRVSRGIATLRTRIEEDLT